MAEPSTSEEKTATSPPPRRRPLAARLLRDVAITLAVVLGGTAAWAYLFVLHPAGTGPAGPAVPAEPFRREWSDRKVLLLGIGDSVTQGFGAAAGFGYFDRLAKTPATDAADMAGRDLATVLPRRTVPRWHRPGRGSPASARAWTP